MARRGEAPALPDLWAKGRPRAPGDPYHPLLCHLIDVATVAEAMWALVLPRAAKRWMAVGLGVDDTAAGKWTAFWAGLHDLGKASPAFFGRENFLQPPAHGIVTAETAGPLLTAPPYDLGRRLAETVAIAIGGHHGTFPTAHELNAAPRGAIGEGSWSERRSELAAELARVIGLEPVERPTSIDTPRAIWLAGFVSVADWIGSNAGFFPFAARMGDPGAATDLDRYRQEARTQADRALRTLGWTASVGETPRLDWEDLFPAIREPNALQRTVLALIEELKEPGLVVVEAPMGEGKTEAALALADNGSAALDLRGHYVALPTRATSDQMFQRVRWFLQRRYPADLVNLQLLHGQASLSTEFKQLKERALFLDPAKMPGGGDGGGDAGDAGVIAAGWFGQRKRGLLAPFGVGTVDQALLAVLQTRHVFVRLFGLTGKTVVIDEVHAYDAYMTTLLERLLAWLGALGCRVVLLSATLPIARRDALLAAYAVGAGLPSAIPEAVDYPRVTWLSAGTAGARGRIETSPRSRKRVRLVRIPTGDNDGIAELSERLVRALAHGGCAAVICNTVDHAQRVYRALKRVFPGEASDGGPTVDLLHARFLYEEREAREQRALRRFGPDGNRPEKAILVATQVIEQSLDLDFDLLVSEFAPIDLLLQRIGRLHRHDRGMRPEGVREPALWLFDPPGPDGAPAFRRAITSVYDEHVLLRTWLVLRGRDLIAVPEDVQGLIEEVYDDAQIWPSDVSGTVKSRWGTTREELIGTHKKHQRWAKDLSILGPDYPPEDFFEHGQRDLDEDDPAVHREVQALTRQGPPTVQVVCLTSGQTEDLRANKLADLDRAVELLRRSVTLSDRRVVGELLAMQPPRAWRKSALLRRHRLVELDEAHGHTLSRARIQLNKDVGVEIIAREGEKA